MDCHVEEPYVGDSMSQIPFWSGHCHHQRFTIISQLLKGDKRFVFAALKVGFR